MKGMKRFLKKTSKLKPAIKQRVSFFRQWALEKACVLYSVRAVNALKQAFSKAH